MSVVYYPSCKLQAVFPQTAQAATEYMKRRGAEVAGCCRDESAQAKEGDTAIYNCNTCAIFLDEGTDVESRLSIYEVLAEDADFLFPDHNGRKMAVQDCWRAHDKPAIHEAVRSLAEKMHIDVLELEETGEDSTFCGETLMMPMPPYYRDFAPVRFGGEQPEGIFVELAPEKRAQEMQAYASKIPVDEVICNCLGCVFGIAAGGKDGVHILELVFGTSK